jgi:hypothetical protein
MKKISQSGFAHIGLVLLLVVVLGVAIGGGYYVWHKNHEKKTPSTTQSNVESNSNDPTSGWKTFVSTRGKFTVKYPASWVTPDNVDTCTGAQGDLFIGPDKQSVLKCASDGTATQVSVTSSEGDYRADSTQKLMPQQYADIQKKTVMADGVTGVQYSGKALHQRDGEGLGGYPDDTVYVWDQFYKNGKSYSAIYTQYPADAKEGPTQNQLNIFNLIVSKTLKFN